MFARNEGDFDRMIRGLVGAALLVLAILVLPGIWQWIGGLVGIVLLVTGLTGVCPAYRLLGMNTCPAEGRN
ncbi:MAG: DUF2892 domain-containing protein [Chloroflexaceae bacterium]|jgi:hypothetical protein